MARLRKMLGSADSPYILSLMRLIETQSNQTIADWCVSYAKENIIPIFEKAYPEDTCLKELLETFEKYRNREIELAGLKKVVASGSSYPGSSINLYPYPFSGPRFLRSCRNRLRQSRPH